jgi:hypothetical protein
MRSKAGRDGFGVVLPDIRQEFGLDLTGVLSLDRASLGLERRLAGSDVALADRTNRARLMWIGALGWASFTS